MPGLHALFNMLHNWYMSTCRLIVYEKTGRWGAALRSVLRGEPPRLVETRSLAGCEAALSDSPFSLVALETTGSNLEAVVAFVQRTSAKYPRCHVTCLLAPEARDAALLVRESGAIAAIDSVLDAAQLARLARRQLARTPSAEIGLRESVWERMPWAAFATTTQNTN
jgi:hypothetical protein